MSEFSYEPSSPEKLEREAQDWDRGIFTSQGWTDAPESIPRIGASISISLRIPAQMLSLLKGFAKREGIGYQVLMKRWLDERIREERDKILARRVITLHQPTMVTVATSFKPNNEQLMHGNQVGR